MTDILEPNDVDCVLLVDREHIGNLDAEAELEADDIPFLGIQVVGLADFELFTQGFFAADRDRKPKGMVELIQWF